MATKPTLNDVASAAGVSLASASRALSGGSASEETVERVRAAAKALGYIPDSTARSLRLGGSKRVAFAVDDIGNPNYVAMLRAIERSFGATGPRVSVSTVGRGPRAAAELVESVAAGLADGLILSPIRVSDDLLAALIACPVPCVVIGSLPNPAPVDTVRIDSARGVQMAVEHLASLGHSRLAFVNGPLDTNPGRARARGYETALASLGLEYDPLVSVNAADFTVAAGREGMEKVLDLTRRYDKTIDAVVCANDLLAIGALNVALTQGIRVPEDLAITGIDDTELAEVFFPSITSVSLRADERGEAAARLLLARFDEPARSTQVHTLEPVLRERASTLGVRS